MPAVFGFVGGVLGDYTKEYIKAETPTNKEEEVRKYYRGGKEVNGILGRNDQS